MPQLPKFKVIFLINPFLFLRSVRWDFQISISLNRRIFVKCFPSVAKKNTESTRFQRQKVYHAAKYRLEYSEKEVILFSLSFNKKIALAFLAKIPLIFFQFIEKLFLR